VSRKSATSIFLLLIFLPSTTATAQLSTVNYFTLPSGYEYPVIIVAGPDGALWFTLEGSIGRIDMLGNANQYFISYSGNSPWSITAGPDGNLWFTDEGTNSIGRVCAAVVPPTCTTVGQITEYPVQTTNSFPTGITAGSDGALWFTEQSANNVGRITTEGGVSEYPVSTPDSVPTGITAGQDGALWFTEKNGNNIGRITITGSVTEYAVETADSVPYAITAGPDGALWFVESAVSQIGRITTASNPTVTEFQIENGLDTPYAITAGADGALWFPDEREGYCCWLGRITTDGSWNLFGSIENGTVGITSGPDGAIWLTEEVGPMIGQAIPSSRRNAVDFSGSASVPSRSALTEFRQAGVQYAAVEAPQIPDDGLAVRQLNALYDAGLQSAAYCFLYFYQGADSGKTQAQNCLNSISGTAAHIYFMALDVEDTKGTLEPLATRIATIQDAIQTITDSGITKIVIYTNQGDWNTLTGDDSTDFAQYALWNAAHGSFTGYTDPAGNYGCVTKTQDRINSLLPKPHGGTGLPSLELPATISAFSITNDVVTITAPNTFIAGQQVSITGLSIGTFLNGKTLTVLTPGLSSSQFTAKLAHKNVVNTLDSGAATLVLFGGWQVQSGTQYDVGATGDPFACLFGVKVDFDVFDPSLFQ
jgi:virginiamycin B lyase